MPLTPLALYLNALRENRALGVKETSSYGALQNLLDSVGADLKPAVRCILHPGGGGAGIPDGGLFTRDQLQPLGHDFEPKSALKLSPARGALEVKGTEADLTKLVASEQVAKYLDAYGKVICTNYREFAVVEQVGGNAQTLETFSMESSEAAFWAATGDLAAFEAKHGESLRAFLERALLYGAPLAAPEAVAAFMASCAREAKVRVERANVDALEKVRASLEAALNVSFRGDANADAFFRSSLVQTLFYGVFSAWILWCRQHPIGSGEKFNWRLSAHYLPVPVIQSLFYEFAKPQTIKTLDVTAPLDWVSEALGRVDRAEFEKRWSGIEGDENGAVQYFYEPFLQAFDPQLRRDLGVWYTPTPIVRYMVARVDWALKNELGIAKGLADPDVIVLDPCCGTGAFLVEVVRHIAATLGAEDALGGADLKSAVLNRIYGFELLTAPFVVAHLQLGLQLSALDVELAEDERASIFLTNALTGWKGEPPQKALQLEGLLQEFEAASQVKSQQKILVILGNPPYSGYAGVAIGEEFELSQAYRKTTTPGLPAPEGQGLNDLYVRFFRMAERKITEDTGRGVVCFISNYSWLDGKSHTAMRETFLRQFSQIWIDNLNGDRYRTGKVAPDGTPDPSVFSTPSNREGIQVGTAIALMARKGAGNDGALLHYRDLWGSAKLAQLEAESDGKQSAEYALLQTPARLGLPFMPTQSNESYFAWPTIPELFPTSFPGVKTSRDEVVVDIDRERLETRMHAYFDPNVSDAEMAELAPAAMKNASGFKAKETRTTLQARGFLPQNIVRFCYRPFDVRWLYWEPETKLLDRNRADYWPHAFVGNWMMAAVSSNRRQFDPPPSFGQIGSLHLIERGANIFPLYLRDLTATALFAEGAGMLVNPNLSVRAVEYLESLLLAVEEGAPALFGHALAIQHSPRYRRDNADALRLDWPRIPLPQAPNDAGIEATRALLLQSGALGARVAQLLDAERVVEGVTVNARPELKVLGAIAKTDGGSLKPELGHLALTVNWGYRAGGAVMPGGGRALERAWTTNERAQIEGGAAELGLDLETALVHLGASCFDVYLNDVAYWCAVPSRVWDYTLGGYRVLKKWLSYRDASVLGRDLTTDEAREVTAIVRRIAALLLLEAELDANYAACLVTGEWH